MKPSGQRNLLWFNYNRNILNVNPIKVPRIVLPTIRTLRAVRKWGTPLILFRKITDSQWLRYNSGHLDV